MKDRLLLLPLLVLLVVAMSGLIGSSRKPVEAVEPKALITVPACLPPVVCTTVTIGPTVSVTATATATVTRTRPGKNRRTVTVTPPPVVRTVSRPSRNETVFRTGPTQTVTKPGKKVTATATATRQVTVTHDTIVPTTRVSERIKILPGTTITVEKVKKVGIGLLSLFIILLCILGGMWFGWMSGIKQGAGHGEPKFLSGIRNAIRLPRGKHR